LILPQGLDVPVQTKTPATHGAPRGPW